MMTSHQILDFLTFPLRAFTLFYEDRWGLSCQTTERYEYVRNEVVGRCLDVGCGSDNAFIKSYGFGEGIDIHNGNVKDLRVFPFDDGSFFTVTFIASLNHAPRSWRQAEVKEAWRVLLRGGQIIVTSPNPLAGILVHKIVWLYDRLFGTTLDVDNIRGMHKEEDYYLSDGELTALLATAGFARLRKKYFWTQWGFNHLWVGTKP